MRTATHTKTGNNTGSFGTRTNNTTTHTKLGITLEASKLESITLKKRKLEVVLILEEQIQLVLTRMKNKVSRSFIYTAKILLETPMLESWFRIVTSVTSPPPLSNEFLRVVLFILSKTETKNLLQEVHVIFTWCGVDPDMLDSNIFGTWFCWVLTMKFVDHFGSISKISSRFPSSFAYVITLPMYKIF